MSTTGFALGVSARRAAAASCAERDPVERVGHERPVRLLGARHCEAGCGRPGAISAGDGVGRVLERLALEQPREQQVAGLEPEQLLVELGVAEVGQEAPGLELDERGRDEQELGGDVEIEGLHAVDLGQVLVDDRARATPRTARLRCAG